MGLVDVRQYKLKLVLGAMKDHASIGKAMLSSFQKWNNRQQGKCFSDIEIAVVRATSHDNGSIVDNHVHEILFLVSNSPTGSTPFLAERISCRLAKTGDPLVALKTLLLIHRLLRGGNRYFEQQLRGAYLSGHLQMSTLRNIPISDSNASFLLNYVAFLEERIGWVINQAGKLEPVMTSSHQGLHFRRYDEKSVDLVFRQLPKCQVFIDKVLNCLPRGDFPSDINNLAQAALSNILKESFQVYMTYCEGVSALVNMFFDLTKQARALACEILKRASEQSQELHDLYEKCKQITGNGYSYSGNLNNHKSMEYPSVQIITVEHVMALELCSSFSSCSYLENPIPSNSSSTGPSKHIGGFTPASSILFPKLNCLTKNSKLQQPAMIGEKVVKGTSNSGLSSSNLFSWKLETKISKVWEVFEDEYQDKVPTIP